MLVAGACQSWRQHARARLPPAISDTSAVPLARCMRPPGAQGPASAEGPKHCKSGWCSTCKATKVRDASVSEQLDVLARAAAGALPVQAPPGLNDSVVEVTPGAVDLSFTGMKTTWSGLGLRSTVTVSARLLLLVRQPWRQPLAGQSLRWWERGPEVVGVLCICVAKSKMCGPSVLCPHSPPRSAPG